MTKIRKSIEDVLAEFVVTDELRHKTLEQIRPRPVYNGFKSGFYFKAITLMSSFIVLLTLSINVFYRVNTDEFKPLSQEAMPKTDYLQEGPTYQYGPSLDDKLTSTDETEEETTESEDNNE